MLKAILLLPVNVLVTIPVLILYLNGYSLIRPAISFAFVTMIICFAAGLSLIVWTIILFAAVGHGSPAPWDPVNKLITTGPYAYMRNPMLTGVFLFLFGEILLFRSPALTWYALIFIMINAMYFPLSEEKALLKRYGKEYEIYKKTFRGTFPASLHINTKNKKHSLKDPAI